MSVGAIVEEGYEKGDWEVERENAGVGCWEGGTVGEALVPGGED